VIVNLEETGASGIADYEYRGDVTEVLPDLVEAVEAARPSGQRS